MFDHIPLNSSFLAGGTSPLLTPCTINDTHKPLQRPVFYTCFSILLLVHTFGTLPAWGRAPWNWCTSAVALACTSSWSNVKTISNHKSETSLPYLRQGSAILFHYAGFLGDDPAEKLAFCRGSSLLGKKTWKLSRKHKIMDFHIYSARAELA